MNRQEMKTASQLMFFATGGTAPLRALLGTSSALWAFGLWLPLGTFERPVFSWMNAIGPEWAWGLVFFAHWVGAFMTIDERKAKISWLLTVNILGVVVWGASTSLELLAVGEFSPAMSLECMGTIALFIVMVRTRRAPKKAE